MSRTRVSTRRPTVIVERFHKVDEDKWGYCYKPKREIHLEVRTPARLKAEIAIHEHLHCAFPDAAEKAILQIAGHIGDTLWNLGFRQVNKI